MEGKPLSDFFGIKFMEETINSLTCSAGSKNIFDEIPPEGKSKFNFESFFWGVLKENL